MTETMKSKTRASGHIQAAPAAGSARTYKERYAAGKALREACPAQRTCHLESPRRPAGSSRAGAGGREGAPARAASPAPRAHGPLPVHLLPRLGARHGLRPGLHSGCRDPRPVLRGRPPVQLRRVRHAGAPGHLRHQRSRRDAPGPVGVGRQAPRGELRRGLPRQRPERRRRERRGHDLRPHLPRVHGRVQPDEDAGAVVLRAGGGRPGGEHQGPDSASAP